MSTNNSGGRDRTYISRDEFTIFEGQVRDGFSNLDASVKGLSSKIDDMKSTDWRTVLTFIGTVITIGVLAATPIYWRITNNENNALVARMEAKEDLRDYMTSTKETLEAIRSKADEAAKDRWTSTDQQKDQEFDRDETRRLEKLVTDSTMKLDDVLQREMRLLDDALQREMRMLLDGPLERLSATELSMKELSQDVKMVRDWTTKHDQVVSAKNADQDARIKHLERLLDKVDALEIELAHRASTVDEMRDRLKLDTAD